MKDKTGMYNVKETIAKFKDLETRVASKALRSAVGRAVTPVKREMKLRAPVGSVPHFTYKHRLVAPGFLRNSIRSRTSIKAGVASAIIGVRAEAFYGVQFVDVGQHGVRQQAAQPWFRTVFTGNQRQMSQDIYKYLHTAIEKSKRK